MPKSIVPLRYPGGKSKVIKNVLSPLFPEFNGHFYDPFIGGGSIVTWIAQMYPEKVIHANDLNPALYNFWQVLKDDVETLVDKLLIIRYENDPLDVDAGRALLKKHKEQLYSNNTDLNRAVSYYVLNKISFSGMTEHGSISKDAYAKTFNPLNIKKLYGVSELLGNVVFYNTSYETLINGCSPNSFVFLDPPYDLGDKKNNLYGKNGDMHSGFDHIKFTEVIKNLTCKWMITYNDNEKIRERFKDYTIMEHEYTYFIAFAEDDLGNKITRKKNELIIINY